MDARFDRGDTLRLPYTPTGPVEAGDVIVIGTTPVVAYRDITSGEMGEVNVMGGSYDGVADGEIDEGAAVYFDPATSKFTVTTALAPHFGFVAPGWSTTTDGDEIRVVHLPNGSVIPT